MKILFLSNLFPPNQIGGYEVLCSRVANLFAERGHEVHVLTSSYGKKISHMPGLEVTQGLRLLCGETIHKDFEQSEMRRQVICEDNEIVLKNNIKRIRPDVVFSWNLYFLSSSFFFSLEQLGVPVVCMLTDNWLAAMVAPEFVGHYMRNNVYNEGNGQDFNAYSRRYKSKYKINCSAIFGAHYMETLYKAAGLEFTGSEVIHNGVDLDVCLARPRISRLNTMGEQRSDIKLLFAGRVVKIKGVHVAIQALDLLKYQYAKQTYRVSLTIVGDNSDTQYMEQLREQIAQLGVEDQVNFLTVVPESKLPDLFDSHDIFLFPSLYEPFSLTLIHAMASGIPVVASDVGGNVEIVKDGQTGLLFSSSDGNKLAEAIHKLALDGDLRERISVAGRQAASHFTLKRMIDKMENHFSRCRVG